VESAKGDPYIMEAVAQAYLPDAIRKIRNKAGVLSNSHEELAAEPKPDDTSEAKPPLDDDWMNAFIRPAEDASSERLQRYLGKMLAGEIKAPGTFSKSTIRLLSELDGETAVAFEALHNRSYEVGTVERTDDFSRGRWWQQLNLLQDAGLVSPVQAAVFAPPPPNLRWAIGSGPVLFIETDSPRNLSIKVINFTKEGRQIGLLLPSRPDYAANLRALADRLPKEGLRLTMLGTQGEEVLWPKP
jgi:hypothetical protein